MIKRLNGFTLLEFIAVISVMGIIAALAVPSFSTLIQNNRLKSASEQVYQKLQYARSEAIKQNQDVYLSFLAGSNWCIGLATAPACSCSLTTNCNLGQINASDFPSINLTTNGFTTTNITFNKLYGAPDASGDFKLNISSRSIDISINEMGRVRICGNNIGGYRPCSTS